MTERLNKNSNALSVTLMICMERILTTFYGLLLANIGHLTCGEILLRTLLNRKPLARPQCQKESLSMQFPLAANNS